MDPLGDCLEHVNIKVEDNNDGELGVVAPKDNHSTMNGRERTSESMKLLNFAALMCYYYV